MNEPILNFLRHYLSNPGFSPFNRSRPEDNFTCKVTLELQTINEYDTKKIQDFLKKHITENGRLGKVIVSAEEFSYKKIGGKPLAHS